MTDVARAILAVLKSPLHRVANEIFNVGNTKENYIISDVGELVKKIIPEVSIKTIKNMDDKRNYKVDFSKIEKTLSFKTQKNVEDGIREIEISIKEGKFGNLEDKKYYNHLVL